MWRSGQRPGWRRGQFQIILSCLKTTSLSAKNYIWFSCEEGGGPNPIDVNMLTATHRPVCDHSVKQCSFKVSGISCWHILLAVFSWMKRQLSLDHCDTEEKLKTWRFLREFLILMVYCIWTLIGFLDVFLDRHQRWWCHQAVTSHWIRSTCVSCPLGHISLSQDSENEAGFCPAEPQLQIL